jgi:hypothetical protein
MPGNGVTHPQIQARDESQEYQEYQESHSFSGLYRGTLKSAETPETLDTVKVRNLCMTLNIFDNPSP